MNIKPEPSTRLGDLLVRAKKLRPHQLGVALAVQRQARVPLGKILVETKVLSKLDLQLALLRQWVMRRFQPTQRKIGLYGSDLMAWGRQLLDRHLKEAQTPESHAVNQEVAETLRLRAELAKLSPEETARIIEKDRDLKERILSGNF